MKKRIVMTGFMGSGKTVVGRTAASLLDWEFADADAQMEAVTGMPLDKLLKKYGEVRFRSEERLILSKLAAKERLVIASGGCADPRSDDLRLLKNPDSFFVLLEADAETLLTRLSRKHNRPFAVGRPSAEELAEMLAAQTKLYEELADFRLNTAGLTIDEAAEMICAAVQKD